MKISELIEELKRVKKIEGDCRVVAGSLKDSPEPGPWLDIWNIIYFEDLAVLECGEIK